jgi:type II secretory pathway predicted ATPase ExeA
MYTECFGLKVAPFSATPDARFFYENRAYNEAYATLLYGIRDRQGFIVLTGEVGTGKTTLLQRLMDELAGTTRFIFLYNTALTSAELVDVICDELELPVEGYGRVKKLRVLNDFLLAEAERGGGVVLLLDEAQNLGPEVLEHLRLISNLETPTEKLLQIVLVGQPELQARLDDPRLRQVRQRVAIRHHLEPLPRKQVGPFIRHRLRVAGRRTTLFSSPAIRRIAIHTRGIPRLINILCHAALLLAYAADARTVSRQMVDEAAADLLLRGRRKGRMLGWLTAMTPRPDGKRAHGRYPDHRRPAMRWSWVATGAAALLSVIAAGSAVGSNAPVMGYAADVGHWLTGLLRGVEQSLRPADPMATPSTLPSGVAVRNASIEPVGQLLEANRTATSSLVELPPRRPELVSDARGDGWRMVVPWGTSISELVSDRYGTHSLLALDLLKELNPHIIDLDRDLAGERLWMPALTLNTLARPQADGSYHLIVASLNSAVLANRLVESMRRTGYDARVTARDITSNRRAHRVLIERLESLEAATRAWRTAQGLGWAPTVSETQR